MTTIEGEEEQGGIRNTDLGYDRTEKGYVSRRNKSKQKQKGNIQYDPNAAVLQKEPVAVDLVRRDEPQEKQRIKRNDLEPLVDIRHEQERHKTAQEKNVYGFQRDFDLHTISLFGSSITGRGTCPSAPRRFDRGRG